MLASTISLSEMNVGLSQRVVHSQGRWGFSRLSETGLWRLSMSNIKNFQLWQLLRLEDAMTWTKIYAHDATFCLTWMFC
jgi:hypothetical protein